MIILETLLPFFPLAFGYSYLTLLPEEEVVAQRGGGKGKARYACPHRGRPKSESLAEFRAMRDGKYQPREAVLRMKQNLEDNNPQMWDLTAYRVLDEKHKHHRTGNKWRIYPTYDFTHCLCDSFEGVTHSLCSTEFELSRVSYNWLCDKVAVYKPMQREFGRLSISGTVLSKRKILALIGNGHVRDWDDPRLYTLIALRRRGVPPEAILGFVNALGVTKAETTIDVKRFEQCVRRYLEVTVPRLMLVLDPIPVVIENIPEDYIEMVELPFSKDPAFGVSVLLVIELYSKIVQPLTLSFEDLQVLIYSRIANHDVLPRSIVFHSPEQSTSNVVTSENPS